MTVYKVWKPGQDEPEVVRALAVEDYGGSLYFLKTDWETDEVTAYGFSRTTTARVFKPHEWSRWSVVSDDAGRL